MGDLNLQDPQQPAKPHMDDYTSAGVYATGLIVVHTKYEFMLDFITAFSAPPQIAARVIVSPSHLKRILGATVDNIGRYEETYGAVHTPPQNISVKSEKAGDIYSKIQVPDELLGGAYSNSMTVMHTRDVFIMDFLTNFPPVSKVVARVIVSPIQMRSVIDAVKSNLVQYESRLGKVEDTVDSDNVMGFGWN